MNPTGTEFSTMARHLERLHELLASARTLCYQGDREGATEQLAELRRACERAGADADAAIVALEAEAEADDEPTPLDAFARSLP